MQDLQRMIEEIKKLSNANYLRFHYGQCLWKKYINCGMKTNYGSDETLKLLFKRCVALALLPINKVEVVFVDMVLEDTPVEKYPLLQEFLQLHGLMLIVFLIKLVEPLV